MALGTKTRPTPIPIPIPWQRNTLCGILVISQAMQIRTNQTELLFRDERQQKETAGLSAKQVPQWQEYNTKLKKAPSQTWRHDGSSQRLQALQLEMTEKRQKIIENFQSTYMQGVRRVGTCEKEKKNNTSRLPGYYRSRRRGCNVLIKMIRKHCKDHGGIIPSKTFQVDKYLDKRV